MNIRYVAGFTEDSVMTSCRKGEQKPPRFAGRRMGSNIGGCKGHIRTWNRPTDSLAQPRRLLPTNPTPRYKLGPWHDPAHKSIVILSVAGTVLSGTSGDTIAHEGYWRMRHVSNFDVTCDT